MTLSKLNEKYQGKKIVLDLNYYECDCEYVLYWEGRYLNDASFHGGEGILSMGFSDKDDSKAAYYRFSVDDKNCIQEICALIFDIEKDEEIVEGEQYWENRFSEMGDEFFEAITSED